MHAVPRGMERGVHLSRSEAVIANKCTKSCACRSNASLEWLPAWPAHRASVQGKLELCSENKLSQPPSQRWGHQPLALNIGFQARPWPSNGSHNSDDPCCLALRYG